MDSYELALEALKIAGIPGATTAALLWYLNKRRESEEKKATELNAIFRQTLEEFNRRESENSKTIQTTFRDLLKTIADTQLVISGTLSRVEQKIDINWSCPIIKDFHRNAQ